MNRLRLLIKRKMFYLLFKIKKKFNIGDVHYINGPETLPAPLTKAEEAIVMERIEKGEKNAREPLITHNLRLVVYIAKKFDSTGAGVEDLISIGTIGLIKAVKTFCPSRNIKLATYASRCIENEILMDLRKNKKRRSEISLEDSLSYDSEGNELRLEDILGTDPDIVTKNLEHETEKNLVMEEINKLNERDREIIVLRYGLMGHKEMTQKDVADMLGISQSYISRIEKKVIKRLRSLVRC